jgi:hypothetical protein
MKFLALLAACTAATPRIPPRLPTPGVAPYPYPSHWMEPAVLCVNRTQLTFGARWSCR